MRKKYTAPKMARRTFKTAQFVGASPADVIIDDGGPSDAIQ